MFSKFFRTKQEWTFFRTDSRKTYGWTNHENFFGIFFGLEEDHAFRRNYWWSDIDKFVWFWRLCRISESMLWKKPTWYIFLIWVQVNLRILIDYIQKHGGTGTHIDSIIRYLLVLVINLRGKGKKKLSIGLTKGNLVWQLYS